MNLLEKQERKYYDALVTIDKTAKERDAEKTRANKAEAACAEMRQCILDRCFARPTSGGGDLWCCQCANVGHHSNDCQVGHSLSTSCGKDWLSPEKKQLAIEALEHIAHYPIHSEPMGGVMDMQDIAAKAIAALKEEK